MKHGLNASNAHLDPLTQHDGPSSTAPVPPQGATVPPASMSMSDPLAESGKASSSTAMRPSLLCHRQLHSRPPLTHSLNASMSACLSKPISLALCHLTVSELSPPTYNRTACTTACLSNLSTVCRRAAGAVWKQPVAQGQVAALRAGAGSQPHQHEAAQAPRLPWHPGEGGPPRHNMEGTGSCYLQCPAAVCPALRCCWNPPLEGMGGEEHFVHLLTHSACPAMHFEILGS